MMSSFQTSENIYHVSMAYRGICTVQLGIRNNYYNKKLIMKICNENTYDLSFEAIQLRSN